MRRSILLLGLSVYESIDVISFFCPFLIHSGVEHVNCFDSLNTVFDFSAFYTGSVNNCSTKRIQISKLTNMLLLVPLKLKFKITRAFIGGQGSFW